MVLFVVLKSFDLSGPRNENMDIMHTNFISTQSGFLNIFHLFVRDREGGRVNRSQGGAAGREKQAPR